MAKLTEHPDPHEYYAFPNRGEMLLALVNSTLESFRNQAFEGGSDSEARHTTLTNPSNS